MLGQPPGPPHLVGAVLFIAGGTGFIGTHLLRALSEKGPGARCLVRSAERAGRCEREGFGAVIGDITDRESLRGRIDGCDTVVHLVGIIEDKDASTFEKVHVEGTGNLVDEAKRAGVRHFFYQSALGASPDSSSRYQKTKALAEETVRQSGIPFTIFRPSLVIGEGDGFTERLKELIGLGPVVTVPGTGNGRFQPIFVKDWVRCFLCIVGNEAALGKLYEFGGPEHLTYNEILRTLMDALNVKKPVVHVPMPLMKAGLPFMGIAQGLGRLVGRKVPSVSSEQLALLEIDNVTALDSVEKAFGFTPLTFREALRSFIRPVSS